MLPSQNPLPSTPTISMRRVSPFSLLRARLRAICHFGRSKPIMPAPRDCLSRIEHVHELTRHVLAGEAQEDVLERVVRFRAATQLLHRTAGHELPALHDADA